MVNLCAPSEIIIIIECPTPALLRQVGGEGVASIRIYIISPGFMGCRNIITNPDLNFSQHAIKRRITDNMLYGCQSPDILYCCGVKMAKPFANLCMATKESIATMATEVITEFRFMFNIYNGIISTKSVPFWCGSEKIPLTLQVMAIPGIV